MTHRDEDQQLAETFHGLARAMFSACGLNALSAFGMCAYCLGGFVIGQAMGVPLLRVLGVMLPVCLVGVYLTWFNFSQQETCSRWMRHLEERCGVAGPPRGNKLAYRKAMLRPPPEPPSGIAE